MSSERINDPREMLKECRTEMSARVKEVETRVENLGVNLAAVKRAVCGEAGNPSREPGLLIRIDRIEQKLSGAARVVWIAVAAIVAQVVVVLSLATLK